jgi:hypothetical protein
MKNQESCLFEVGGLTREMLIQRHLENPQSLLFTVTHHLDGCTSVSFVSPGTGGTGSDLYALCAAPDEVVSKRIEPMLALIHCDDIDRYFDEREAARRKRSLFHTEFRILHPEKGERWVELLAVPECESDGATRWHSYLVDISARNRDST